MVTDDFVVSGSSNESLLGICESLYIPDQVRSLRFCLAARCFVSADSCVGAR